jgi:hypothetical protein
MGKKGVGDNNNANPNSNANGIEKDKNKVNFPCKLCKDDHLTHLCPKIEEALRLIAQ